MIYPWQVQQWQQLHYAKQAGRLPHALLLTGLRGVGKLHFAHAFTQSLLCQKSVTSTALRDDRFAVSSGRTEPPGPGQAPFKNVTGQACGECKACHLVANGTHPNILSVVSDEPGQMIKIEQIRAVTDFVYQSALQDNYRIVMLNVAHKLNVNAANALLKTLEEPTPGVIFILITERPGQLPATILSRCQRLVFSHPPREVALAWLKTKLPADQTVDPVLLLNLSGGAPLAALEWMQGDLLMTRQTLLNALCQLHTPHAEPLKVAVALQKMEIEYLLAICISWSVDILRLQLGAGCAQIVNQDYLATLSHLKTVLSQEALLNYLTLLETVQTDIERKININKQMAIEALLIKWCALCF